MFSASYIDHLFCTEYYIYCGLAGQKEIPKYS